ncbi:MAG: hypothetical protein QM776_03045 [Rhodocyclaceae bacterium]
MSGLDRIIAELTPGALSPRRRWLIQHLHAPDRNRKKFPSGFFRSIHAHQLPFQTQAG